MDPSSINCCMSLCALFRRANGRSWTAEEERSFQALDQPARNAAVRELALAAGDVRVEDRRGSDGRVYAAFWIDPSVRSA